MSNLAFLDFEPVPVRSRRDGWTADIQRRFVLALARGAGVTEAARLVGRSRQTAYALRGRDGGEGFAAAWDSAIDVADGIKAAPRPLGFAGIETLLVPRFYRGRLIGFVQRDDCAGAIRRLALLDRAADRLERRDRDRGDLAAAAAAPLATGSNAGKADEADSIRHTKGAMSSASKRRLRQARPDRLE